jgi:hypothetical protein
MLRPVTFAIAALFSIAILQSPSFAPAQGDANPGFEKKAYNYSEWTKGKFLRGSHRQQPRTARLPRRDW